MSVSYNFLDEVAIRLVEKNPSQLHNSLVILPTKRACLFFERSLQSATRKERPFIAPVITTIDKWIESISTLILPENTTLLCYLYNAYDQYLQERPEYKAMDFNTPLLLFDRAQKMLADYEDIDLSLQNAERIFTNIRHLNELETYDYLTDEQKQTIVDFWGQLPAHIPWTEKYGEQNFTIQEFFIHLSDTMLNVYNVLKDKLRQEGCGYRGMIYRTVAELTAQEIIERTRKNYGNELSQIYFAGLYSLSLAERKIIRSIKEYTAEFSVDLFWESISIPFREGVYFPNQTITQNKQLLGGEVISITSKNETRVEIINASSSIVQPQYIEHILKNILEQDARAIDDLRIAVVLSDERTLIPMLNSLHLSDLNVNITMGYPLKSTMVAIWIQRYLEIYHKANRNSLHEAIEFPVDLLSLWLRSNTTEQLFGKESHTLLDILQKQYFYTSYKSLSKQYREEIIGRKNSFLLFEEIFPPLKKGLDLINQVDFLLERLLQFALLQQEKGQNSTIQNLEIEYIYRYQELLRKLRNTMADINYFDDPDTAMLLLQSLINAETIPFEGEPLKGLQVMGFLETRSLSFDYVIFLDVKEGQLPKSSKSSSLIPYSLRIAYGLPTYRTKEDISTYHFYRLLNGTSKIFFLQDVRTKSLDKNTPSRYLDQLTYLTTLPFSRKEITMPLPFSEHQSIEIDKRTLHIEQILNRFLDANNPSEALSPSDINTYYQCPLRFYFSKIKKLAEPQNKEEILSASSLGTVVHNTLERLLTPILAEKKPFQRDLIDDLLIETTLREVYQEHRYGNQKQKTAWLDIDEINLADLRRFVHNALFIDSQIAMQKNCLLYFDGFEVRVTNRLTLPDGKQVNLKGFIDRLDHLTDLQGNIIEYRVVDYKTGKIELLKSTHLEKSSALDRQQKIVQLYLYAYFFNQLRISGEVPDKLKDAQPLQSSPFVVPLLYGLKPQYRGKKESQAYWLTSQKESVPVKLPIDFDNYPLEAQQTHLLIVGLVQDIFDLQKPFTQTANTEICKNCPYVSICGR